MSMSENFYQIINTKFSTVANNVSIICSKLRRDQDHNRIHPFFAFAKSLLLVHSTFLIDTFTSNSHVSCYYERAYL